MWGSMFGKGKAYPELGGERGMGQGWYGAIGKLAIEQFLPPAPLAASMPPLRLPLSVAASPPLPAIIASGVDLAASPPQPSAQHMIAASVQRDASSPAGAACTWPSCSKSPP